MDDRRSRIASCIPAEIATKHVFQIQEYAMIRSRGTIRSVSPPSHYRSFQLRLNRSGDIIFSVIEIQVHLSSYLSHGRRVPYIIQMVMALHSLRHLINAFIENYSVFKTCSFVKVSQRVPSDRCGTFSYMYRSQEKK